MAERNLYLSNTPAEEALKKFFAAFDGQLKTGQEEIPAEDCLNRITSEAVYARFSSPLFNAAAMDGIAVRAAATAGARESNPLILKAGEDFISVDTGDPVYDPYDAVIMAEDLIQIENSGDVKIMKSASAWQHVRPIGEDIVSGEMILARRHRIRPIDIGVLFSGGITRVKVFLKPSVAIFPTGTEIVDAQAVLSRQPRSEAAYKYDEVLKKGAVIESNSRMFEALVRQQGGDAVRFDPLPDDYDLIKESVAKAAREFDMVLINAGSSAGTEDFTVHALREIGEVIVHGVAMKPGKPVILAKVNGKPVIGTPGYPVSAYLAYETFASPVLAILAGSKVLHSGDVSNENFFDSDAARLNQHTQKFSAVITKRIVSSLKHREYVRVKAGRVNGKLVASPLARGAGAAMSLVRADGFCVIDQRSEGIEAGETAAIELYRSIEEIDRTLVAAGSHDLILDVIADMMSFSGRACLASAHTGSLAGLASLKRGECHIAPVHLLDEETGAYNVSWIKNFFNETQINSDSHESENNVCLIKGVGRVQGLIIQKNNPLGIKSLADICHCHFINRQRGAGTRIFLDHLLKKENIDSNKIEGYKREAATHMAVAAAVHGGSADAGMGIAAAAKALDLDFIPLGQEEYDFAVFSDYLKLNEMKIFIEILKSDEFHKKLAGFTDAYTWDRAGEIIFIN